MGNQDTLFQEEWILLLTQRHAAHSLKSRLKVDRPRSAVVARRAQFPAKERVRPMSGTDKNRAHLIIHQNIKNNSDYGCGHGFPGPHKSTRGLGGPSVYATHIKITGFSIVKSKRVTVSYF